MKKLLITTFLILLNYTCCLSEGFFNESAQVAFGFYHNIMSPVRKPVSECPFYPSCSIYAEEAVKEYGFVVGTVMAAERLTRCSHIPERNEYPKAGRKFYDPPSKNYLFGHGGLWASTVTKGRSVKVTDAEVIRDFSFAYNLYSQKEYDYSVIELKRAQFSSADTEIRQYADVLSAVNFLEAGNTYKARLSIDKASPVRENFRWNKFIVNYLINDMDFLNSYNINRCSVAMSEFPANRNNVLKLQILSMVKAEEFDEANENLKQLATLDKDYLVDNTAVIIDNLKNYNGRSPWIAGSMSAIIPGSGYLYNGDYMNAFSAFIVNGLLGFGIYTYVKDKNYAPAVFLSSFALPFYIGNIVGSVNLSMSKNQKDKEQMYAELRKVMELNFYFSTDFFKSCWKE